MFLSFDEDLTHASRYVEFRDPNLGTYSIESARLLLGISSEIEAVLKDFRRKHGDQVSGNFPNWFRYVVDWHSNIRDQKIEVKRTGRLLRPWGLDRYTVKANGDRDSLPDWWNAHNKVKHDRRKNFRDATWGNCIYAAAGLYTLTVCLYWEVLCAMRLLPNPTFFRLVGGEQLFQIAGWSSEDGRSPLIAPTKK